MGKWGQGGRQHSRVPRRGAAGPCPRGSMDRCEGTQPHGHSLMDPLELAGAGPISGGDLVHDRPLLCPSGLQTTPQEVS